MLTDTVRARTVPTFTGLSARGKSSKGVEHRYDSIIFVDIKTRRQNRVPYTAQKNPLHYTEPEYGAASDSLLEFMNDRFGISSRGLGIGGSTMQGIDTILIFFY